jgi:tetratricopeptide (TPR) repeat protein
MASSTQSVVAASAAIRALLEQGESELALEQARELAEAHPRDFGVQVLISELYRHAGHPAAAADAARAAIRLNAREAAGHWALAETFLLEDHLDEAAAAARDAAAAAPDAAASHTRYAEILSRAGELREAWVAAHAALTLDAEQWAAEQVLDSLRHTLSSYGLPPAPSPEEWAAAAAARREERLGNERYYSDDYVGAIGHFSAALQAIPDSPSLRARLRSCIEEGYPLPRWWLAYCEWAQRYFEWIRGGVAVAALLMSWEVIPLTWALLAGLAVMLTIMRRWIAVLLVRLHPGGGQAVDSEEMVAALGSLGLLAGAAVGSVLACGQPDPFIFAIAYPVAVVCILLVMPYHALSEMPDGRAREAYRWCYYLAIAAAVSFLLIYAGALVGSLVPLPPFWAAAHAWAMWVVTWALTIAVWAAIAFTFAQRIIVSIYGTPGYAVD